MIEKFEDLAAAADDLIKLCRAQRITIATAESCTGGLVAAALTEVSGSSTVFDRAFVTYSNEAKAEMLDVPAALIARHGAVSEEVARRMVTGVLEKTNVDIAVAITGIAGPTGGTDQKPVGLVHLAVAARDGRVVHSRRAFPDSGRHSIRLAAVAAAFAMMGELIAGPAGAGTEG